MKHVVSSLCGLGLLALVACKDEPRSQGTPPPPPPSASASANVCAGGGGKIGDVISARFFPPTLSAGGTWCLDPHGDDKTYGDKGKLKIDELCTTALDGGCEEYKKFGVTRSVIVHYVANQGTGGVEVFLSQFAGDGAYAIYTTRLTGEMDPLDEHAARTMNLGAGLGALGTGKAYAWRGPYFLELTYTNDQETPEQMKKSADVILSAIAKDVAPLLPNDPDAPASAKALPEAERVPNGVMYFPKDLLGVPGALGAMGYYKGAKRYRMIASVRDADQAKDFLHALRGKPGALPVASLGDEAVQVVIQPSADRAKIEWVVARKGGTVIGAGDEEFAIDARPTKDEKIATVRAALK
ncbi:MAG TPA: DUF6599 family protein [Polyangiaceae bacterium]|jgi:hypothetical protein|nr:DUF6599 family protein [Polyangiaceae bacterium]